MDCAPCLLFAYGGQDGVDSRGHILQHERCWQAECADVRQREISVAFGVPLRSALDVVHRTINLDREARRVTVEVQHVSSERMLSSESQTLLRIPSEFPP